MTATTFRQRLMAGAVVAVLASALTACSGRWRRSEPVGG